MKILMVMDRELEMYMKWNMHMTWNGIHGYYTNEKAKKRNEPILRASLLHYVLRDAENDFYSRALILEN